VKGSWEEAQEGVSTQRLDGDADPSCHLRVVLPDGAPATTATVTAAPNPTQQWAITLDGTIVKDVPVSSFAFLLFSRT
jgi:uncharacterized protein YdeI (BOF family)